MSTIKLIAAAAGALLIIGGVALAQGTGTGPVGTQCKDDIAKFCAGKQHGGGEVRACLEANKTKVQAACKTALEATGPGRGQGK